MTAKASTRSLSAISKDLNDTNSLNFVLLVCSISAVVFLTRSSTGDVSFIFLISTGMVVAADASKVQCPIFSFGGSLML